MINHNRSFLENMNMCLSFLRLCIYKKPHKQKKNEIKVVHNHIFLLHHPNLFQNLIKTSIKRSSKTTLANCCRE